MSSSSTPSTSSKSASSELPQSASVSTSTGSSNLGPRRFRGDVPLFNPTGQSPHMYSQQVHYPPQVPAQNLGYPQQPQYYVQQPQFVYGNQGFPYYPMVAYPDYAYPYQYYAMGHQYAPQPYMNMNMNMNGYTPRKKHNKHHGNYNGYKNSHQWSSNSATPADITPTLDSGEGSAIDTESAASEASGVDQSNVEKPEEVHEENNVQESKTKRDTETDNVTNAEETTTEEAVAEETPGNNHTEQTESANRLPLLFNTNIDEFRTDKKDAARKNHALMGQKSTRLDTFVAHNEENVVINPHARARVFDHNNNNAYVKHIFQSPSQGTKANDNDNTDSASTQKPPSNWASFLQTTAKKPTKKGQLRKTSPTDVVTVATPEAAAPSISDNKSPQPLGALAIRMLFDPEFHLNECDQFDIKPRGLTNSGNICYMNAVLQCLIFCEPLNKVFKLIQEQAIGNLGDNSPTPLIDATIQFLSDFVNIPSLAKPNTSVVNSDGIVIGRPLSPESLYMKLIENTKFQHLKWGEQEDAEEFLNFFLDGLHEEFVKVESTVTNSQMEKYFHEFSRHLDSVLSAELKTKMKEATRLVSSLEHKHVELNEVNDDEELVNGWSEVGSRKRVSKKRIVEVEPTPITQIFGGQFRSVLTIPKAKESQSITVDPFRCILVDISSNDVKTIEDAFWKFNEAEKLPYKIDSTREVIAKKQTFIDDLPNILILQLKRFSYQHEQDVENEHEEKVGDAEEVRAVGVIEKVMKNIKYGLDLTIPPECLSAAVRNSQKRDYQLTGVIYHHGRNVEGGHYTCDVRRDADKWLRIDDTAVEIVEASDVIEKPETGDKSAYILMYERK